MTSCALPHQRWDLNASRLRYFSSGLVLAFSFYVFCHSITVLVDTGVSCGAFFFPPSFSSLLSTCVPRSGHKCMTRRLAAHIKEEGDSRLLFREREQERERGGIER